MVLCRNQEVMESVQFVNLIRNVFIVKNHFAQSDKTENNCNRHKWNHTNIQHENHLLVTELIHILSFISTPSEQRKAKPLN